MSPVFYGAAALFVVLQVLDIVSTARVLRAGGYEKMWLGRLFMRVFGEMPGMVILKLTIGSLVVFLTTQFVGGWVLLAALSAYYVRVVRDNFRVLAKIRRQAGA